MCVCVCVCACVRGAGQEPRLTGNCAALRRASTCPACPTGPAAVPGPGQTPDGSGGPAAAARAGGRRAGGWGLQQDPELGGRESYSPNPHGWASGAQPSQAPAGGLQWWTCGRSAGKPPSRWLCLLVAAPPMWSWEAQGQGPLTARANRGGSHVQTHVPGQETGLVLRG